MNLVPYQKIRFGKSQIKKKCECFHNKKFYLVQSCSKKANLKLNENQNTIFYALIIFIEKMFKFFELFTFK